MFMLTFFGLHGVWGSFRLQAMKREIHLRELQLLDAVRRRFMHHQQTLKETELQRLDDEIERKVSKRHEYSTGH